jgi:hypothetical protein
MSKPCMHGIGRAGCAACRDLAEKITRFRPHKIEPHERVVVTPANFAEMLTQGAREALEYARRHRP